MEGTARHGNRGVIIRRLVLLLVLIVAGYVTWRALTRLEGYTGGDVQTTGTIEAVQVQLGFQVGGRIADVPVREGDRVQPGAVVARLESSDLEVQVQMARVSNPLTPRALFGILTLVAPPDRGGAARARRLFLPRLPRTIPPSAVQSPRIPGTFQLRR